MFGKGLYFADCPLKSLQYSSLPLGLGFFGCGQRYMLLCAVELGTTKVKTTASNHLDPDRDLRPSLLQRALLGRRDFDSVSARPKSWFGFGLRAPEYVVYDARQPIWLKMPSVLLEGSALSALLVAQRVRMLLLCPTRLLSLKLDMTSAPRPGVPPR